MSGVYTVPEARGKGYAANIIYQLTNKALADGYHVSLYTDYKYIPSNKAYKNVGYVDNDVLINFSCNRVKVMEENYLDTAKHIWTPLCMLQILCKSTFLFTI